MHPRVKDYLLNSMADDYENFEMLFSETLRQAKQQGQVLNRAETLEAIEQLISQGLAQAYILSPTPPFATPVEFRRSDVEQLWFYITPTGKRFVTSSFGV